MKLLELTPFDGKITIKDMLPHQVGITDHGNIFVKLNTHAICLNRPECSFISNAANIDTAVKLLPQGTKIVLEV